jgi:isopentenyl-diphosphate delta-isomerase type 1
MSKEAWAFISGVLFYLFFGAYFVVELIKNLIKKRKYANEEWLAEVDEDGKIIGKITRTQAHNGSLKLHPVIHVHIFNNKGNLLLQKRNINKKIQPGKWDTSVGGHISYGEKIEDALERETFEEIGLKNIKFQFLTKYVWQSEIERELVFVFGAKCDDINFIPNEEVDKVKFWNKKELEQNLKKGVFTPNFEVEYEKLLKQIIK